MKKGWKFVGWLFVPYIMIFFQWNKLSRIQRGLGVTWAVICLMSVAGNKEANQVSPDAVANQTKQGISQQIVSNSNNQDTSAESQDVTEASVETATKADEVSKNNAPVSKEEKPVQENKQQHTTADKPSKANTKAEVVKETEPEPEPDLVIEEEAETDVYYQNCSAVREAGEAPLFEGEPGYSTKLDRDRDGVACE
ncbi:excalibur calcium-binding domain-containing protein [Paenibacillus sp. WLX2291]|uniref:excalibur calcium-binding domain-containing protein n=1 Tax=Paenibacillus sp. WLX2291 TaxID=3296934 RepID=UPI0039842BED